MVISCLPGYKMASGKRKHLRMTPPRRFDIPLVSGKLEGTLGIATDFPYGITSLTVGLWCRWFPPVPEQPMIEVGSSDLGLFTLEIGR